MSSSSSSNSNPPMLQVHDVFLSFRGDDTRNGFTSHLYNALIRTKYKTFYDNDNLKRGKSIATELLKAIKDSRSSIVVLSKKYACSTWCLTELAKIVQCMESKGLIVLPIFYHVDPSHVRRLSSERYKQAFVAFENNPNLDSKIVQSWRNALKTVGNLAGWTVEERDNEAKFIDYFIENLPNILDVQKEYRKEPERVQSKRDEAHTIFECDNIVLPRSKIPAWFTNESLEPSISIQLNPSINYDGNWMGFIFCVIFRGNPSDHFCCEMRCVGENWEIGTVSCPINRESSNYIWMFYLPRDILPIEWLNSSQRVEFSFRPKTAFYNYHKMWFSSCGPCGFLLVYENDTQELNQLLTKYCNELPHQNDRNEPFSNPPDEDSLSFHRTELENSETPHQNDRNEPFLNLMDEDSLSCHHAKLENFERPHQNDCIEQLLNLMDEDSLSLYHTKLENFKPPHQNDLERYEESPSQPANVIDYDHSEFRYAKLNNTMFVNLLV